MATPELLDERLISGRGVLKIPEAARKMRYFRVFFDVIRDPRNPYLSFQWNPPQGLYARLVFRRNGYVQSYDDMKFEREERRFVADIAGQSLIAIKCAYEGTLQSYVNLAVGLGLTVTSVVNLIEDFQTLQLTWDEILFSCYADTALQVRLYGTDYDYCGPLPSPPNDPPPPPPPLPKVPPGTPIGDISEPYDPDTNDGGNTQPFPDDSIPPPNEPPGLACVQYRIVVRVLSDEAFGEPTPGYRDFTVEGWGEFSDPYIEESTNSVKIDFRGSLLGPCLESQISELIVNLGGFLILGLQVQEFTEL